MKKLIIMISVPGAGKSTLTKKLCNHYIDNHGLIADDIIVCSTDNYFMENGVYKFCAAKLGWYHNLNQQLANSHMSCGCPLVIIDNTNLTVKERKPYIAVGLQYGYDIECVEPDTPWKWDIDELVKRNTHGVPRQSIERMVARYQPFTLAELE